jgi:hypothetical protein
VTLPVIAAFTVRWDGGVCGLAGNTLTIGKKSHGIHRAYTAGAYARQAGIRRAGGEPGGAEGPNCGNLDVPVYTACYVRERGAWVLSDVTTSIGITAPYGSVFRSFTDLADLPHSAGSLF